MKVQGGEPPAETPPWHPLPAGSVVAAPPVWPPCCEAPSRGGQLPRLCTRSILPAHPGCIPPCCSGRAQGCRHPGAQQVRLLLLRTKLVVPCTQHPPFTHPEAGKAPPTCAGRALIQQEWKRSVQGAVGDHTHRAPPLPGAPVPRSPGSPADQRLQYSSPRSAGSRGRPGHRTPVGMNCKGCTPPSLHTTRSPPRWGMTSSAEIQRTHPIRSLTFPPASHPNPQGLFHRPRQHPDLATRCCLPHPTWEKLTGHVQD